MSSYSLTMIFTNPVKEKHVKMALLHAGARGATWLYGRGTCSSPLLCMLGLDNQRREMCMVVHPNAITSNIMSGLEKACHFSQKGHGVAVTLPIEDLYGVTECTDGACQIVSRKGVESSMSMKMIVVVVDKGRGEDVVEAAEKGGAGGATIVHGRGSGAHRVEHFFNFTIEPEKELVYIVASSDDTPDIIASIQQVIDFDAPNTGILFTLNASETLGIKRK